MVLVLGLVSDLDHGAASRGADPDRRHCGFKRPYPLTKIAFGIDLDGLAAHAQVKSYPKVVPGRVVHVDGDFLAYQCSYEKEGDPKTFEDMCHNLEEALGILKGYSAADKAVIHLTPKTSNKGGRFEIAMLKEYQGNRKDKEKPRFLTQIRDHMEQRYGAIQHQNCEADDGMSAAQYAAIKAGNENLSIIATKDKDLNMVPGLHLVWDTGEIQKADAWGWIKAVDGKLKGYGSKFFWAQVLRGDTADNISGLQWVMPNVLNRIDPTQATQAAEEKLKTDPNNEKAKRTLAERRPKQCGPVMVEKILANVKNDKQAFEVCKALYRAQADQGYPFLHWRNPAEEVPYGKALLSEMQLLWMRRNPDDRMDVITWLQEVTASTP